VKWLPLLAIIAFAVYLLATDHAAAAEWLRLLGGNR
jgi:hypothetical protein